MRYKCTSPIAKLFGAACVVGFVMFYSPATSQADTASPYTQSWSDPSHKAELRRRLDEFRYPENRRPENLSHRFPVVRNSQQFVPAFPSAAIVLTFLVILATASLLFLPTKSPVQKGSAKMTTEPSTQEFDIKPTLASTAWDTDSRVETWRDAALFFAVAASSALMFSKLGIKIVSACAAIRMDTPTRGFDAMWIIRILAALFVACISVYLFKRFTKDTEVALKNSLACNVGLGFAAVALLLTHSNGIQIISFVGDCLRGASGVGQF